MQLLPVTGLESQAGCRPRRCPAAERHGGGLALPVMRRQLGKEAVGGGKDDLSIARDGRQSGGQSRADGEARPWNVTLSIRKAVLDVDHDSFVGIKQS